MVPLGAEYEWTDPMALDLAWVLADTGSGEPLFDMALDLPHCKGDGCGYGYGFPVVGDGDGYAYGSPEGSGYSTVTIPSTPA